MGEAKRRREHSALVARVSKASARAHESGSKGCKTVTVDITVRLAVEVPEDWDDGMVEFWIIDSSLCGGSFVASELERGSCGCDKLMAAKVVR